jgi:hypothetical protein
MGPVQSAALVDRGMLRSDNSAATQNKEVREITPAIQVPERYDLVSFDRAGARHHPRHRVPLARLVESGCQLSCKSGVNLT